MAVSHEEVRLLHLQLAQSWADNEIHDTDWGLIEQVFAEVERLHAVVEGQRRAAQYFAPVDVS